MAEESAELAELRRELAHVDQMIDNQEMRVRAQSNPFLKVGWESVYDKFLVWALANFSTSSSAM